MVHSLLKLWCKISLQFFFRKWEVHRHSPLLNTPTIFLANHPNAFLDAILIACSISQKPWFLARGEVFKSKWSSWILSKLRMIPIFRFRDGHSSLRKNEDMINRCADLLVRGESILLFPEGENSIEGTLLPLQKGFVKIAEAALKAKPDLNLAIVSVGINYTSKGFGGTALVNVGEWINYSEFVKNKSTVQILNSTWEKLNELITIVETDSVQKKNALIHHVNNFYFLINNFILKSLIGFVVSFIKEEQMKNSVRFAAGMFLAMPFYLAQSLVIFLLSNSWVIALLYFSSLRVSIEIRLKS
jgi:1-acyl-sn-glycerol-3-phosphate acyltransferase